jgi:hypothetical protein
VEAFDITASWEDIDIDAKGRNVFDEPVLETLVQLRMLWQRTTSARSASSCAASGVVDPTRAGQVGGQIPSLHGTARAASLGGPHR